MTGHKLLAVHMSSRWDRSPRSLELAVGEAMDHADLLTVTEVDIESRGRALKRVATEAGWILCRAPGGAPSEVALLIRPEAYTLLDWRVRIVAPDTGAGLAPAALVAAVRHRESGRVLIVATSHLPSGVEGSWRKRTRRVLAHQLAVRRIRRLVRGAYRVHRAHAWYFAADWNLDLHRRWVRTWIRSTWPGSQLPTHAVAAATHAGGRLIDWTLSRNIEDPTIHVLDSTDGEHFAQASDHRPIWLRGWLP